MREITQVSVPAHSARPAHVWRGTPLSITSRQLMFAPMDAELHSRQAELLLPESVVAMLGSTAVILTCRFAELSDGNSPWRSYRSGQDVR
jgi:hypothetical protein